MYGTNVKLLCKHCNWLVYVPFYSPKSHCGYVQINLNVKGRTYCGINHYKPLARVPTRSIEQKWKFHGPGSRKSRLTATLSALDLSIEFTPMHKYIFFSKQSASSIIDYNRLSVSLRSESAFRWNLRIESNVIYEKEIFTHFLLIKKKTKNAFASNFFRIYSVFVICFIIQCFCVSDYAKRRKK